jgi:hypothetical protein
VTVVVCAQFGGVDEVSRSTVEQERIGEVGLDDAALRLGHLQSSQDLRSSVQACSSRWFIQKNADEDS